MSAAQKTAESPVALRLPPDLIERADLLMSKLEHLPEFSLSKPSRSAILRLAILRGLDVLEEEAKHRK
jgi:hypothetical protein